MNNFNDILVQLFPKKSEQHIRVNLAELWLRFAVTMPTHEQIKVINQIKSENRIKACHTFQQLFWEMWLFDHFTSLKVEFIDRKSIGPDFGFKIDGKRVWVEAVCPVLDWRAKREIARQRQVAKLGNATFLNPEIFMLRWTNAIDAKIRQFTKYKKIGIVHDNDVCIVALNAALLGHNGLSGWTFEPILFEILMGMGKHFMSFNQNTGQTIRSGISQEATLSKKTKNGNLAPIPKNFFLEDYGQILTAALASNITPYGQITTPFPLLMGAHNPNAYNQVEKRKLGLTEEYSFRIDGEHWISTNHIKT